MRYSLPTAVVVVGFTLGCAAGDPLASPNDVSGNFDVVYADSLRIYIDDTLVADVSSSDAESVTWNGQTFEVAAVCGESGTTCPSEAYWASTAVEQPWGDERRLLNFISLDVAGGSAGIRMGGLLDDDGHFAMLAGLDADGNEACAAIGVGTVEGDFVDGDIANGVIAVEWGAGCVFGDAEITGSLRLETDFTAVRTGPFDVSSIQPEPPIDETGEEIENDPEP